MLVATVLTGALGIGSVARADVRTEARTHFRRGMALIAEGRVDEGVAALQEAYEILPHPNVLYNIARAYAESARYDEARDYFERYLETDPPDRSEVQQFLVAIGDRQAAVEARERARQTTEPGAASTSEPSSESRPLATSEEIQALEDSATQIAALAEATQSEALRRRADQLRALAVDLRGRMGEGSGARVVVESGGGGSAGGEAIGGGGGAQDPAVDPTLAIREAEADVYEESVVSAARFAQSPLDAPASTTVISRQDIRLSGLYNLPEVLRRAAGVDVMTTTPVDSNLGIRGFNQRLSNRVLVLVDGRSTYIDTLGATLWMTLPVGPSDVERIEIIRGPASALYGANSFSGIVNVITRPPGEPSTEAIVGGGNGNTLWGHAQTSGRIERLAYRIAAGYLTTHRFTREVGPDRVDYFTPDEYGDPAAATAGGFANASLRYRIIPELQVSLQGGVVDRLQNFQGTGPLRDFIARGPVAHVLGSIETPYGSIRAFYTHFDAQAQLSSVPRGGDPVRGDFVSGTFDVEAEFAQEFDLLVHHNLHVGASYRRKTVAWDYLGQAYEQNHYALFIQDAMRLTEWLSLVGSFRTDFHPLLPDPVFSPRGALLVHPSERSTIRASVGTAFRTPTFLESYLDLRNPTPIPGVHVIAQGSEIARGGVLQPENILSAELGYRNEEFEFLDFEINVYYNRVSNLISLAQVQPFRLADYSGGVDQGDFLQSYSRGTASYPVGTITFQNEPPIFDVVGGEAMTRIYPVTGLDIYANYAINQTFTTVPATASGVFRADEARTSTHHVNAGIQYRSEFGLDISVDFHFASEQRWLEQVFTTEDGGGVAYGEFDLPAYYLINARIGYRMLDDHLDIGIVGFNITDNRHRQHPFGQELSARFMLTVAYRM
ncbi:TonB-dependent receptor domain-containing protein [Sandaracinus amylolyticus]|uniref:TonB-dependent receptor n=1 Tax=Sandaracinus amylolyticus TaxID=927083 RepID=A0A0F6YF84_9BACT|nr:TonB-dependent receptor [Sandaracinus amylolyticus]